MRTQLAEKLLVRIMEWSPRIIMKERPLLQALATFKYDEYQQFSPGTRFIESLVKWLSQFKKIHQRQVAYNFIKSNLIFISQDQMVYLVNLTFTDRINPHLIRKSSVPPLSEFQVSKIVESAHYKEAFRRSLFIGLSDGARMDQLRRSAHLSNEQVILTYEIGQPKATGLIKDLEKEKYAGHFSSFFLIDDFTASGTSYFRFENNEWKGKIFKTLESLLIKKDKNGDLYELANHDGTVEIHIIFYIATKSAIEKLNDRIFLWQQEKEVNFSFTIETVQLIDDDVRDETVSNTEFIKLAEEYFDSSIVDEHFKKAKCDQPHLGYDECGLPLVLVHNTPNNSLPVLWLPDDKDFAGLFPRVTRHK
jgi:hypothetical protein